MTTLIFKPFTKKEIDDLLSLFPPITTVEASYKTTAWFDKQKKSFLYGIMCRHTGKKEWDNISHDNRALVFSEEFTAKKICKFFRSADARLRRSKSKIVQKQT